MSCITASFVALKSDLYPLIDKFIKMVNFEDVLTALISAVIIYYIVLLYNFFISKKLEGSLKKAINTNGITISYDSSTFSANFSIQIHNYSNATIRVRKVVFKAEKFSVELKPAKNIELSQNPLDNEVLREKFKPTKLYGALIETNNIPGTMVLPAKTMGQWEVDSERVGAREWVIIKIFIVFEYPTIFGNSALIRMEVDDTMLKFIKERFEPLAKAAHQRIPYKL